MRIGGFKYIEGPNIYRYDPVLVMKLYLDDLAETSSAQIPGFTERLLEILPGLQEHVCSTGAPGGLVERLREGTFLGHIIEHIALELSDAAGISEHMGKTRYSGESTAYNVIVACSNEAGMRLLLETAVALAEAVIRGEPFPLEERIEQARTLVVRTQLGPSTRAIVNAAGRRGIPWIRLNNANLIQFGYGKHRKLIEAAMSDASSAVAVEIASDKQLTKTLLERADIPVPHGRVVASESEALEAWEELASPVVVKPLDGSQGRGVSLNLTSAEQVAAAYRVAREISSSVLVEELFQGRDYRVLVIGGKVVAASERVPASVVGDGARTLEQLVEEANRDPRRGEGHDKPLTFIPIDSIALAHLAKSGLDLSSIPVQGERVCLRDSANLSTGGTAVDVTDAIHPETVRICERAVRIVGLDICGVDLVTENIAKPLARGNGIIELNASPGLRMHVFPSEGQSRPVGDAIINTLYPPGTSGRIPIVAITGTNGKTTVTRMIRDVLTFRGDTVGMTTTDGIHIGNEMITHGDHTGPRSARVVLSDPSVDIAVLETARGGIARSGLGYDWSDVGIITNIQPDHIGQDGIKSVDDLIFIKSLIAERVRENGTLVLNADDANVLTLRESPRLWKVNKTLVYFSLDPDNPYVHTHQAVGGTAYLVRNGWIVEARGETEEYIVRVTDIPATMNGAAQFNIANALAAIAACRALGVTRQHVAEAIAQFGGETSNRGRVNLYRVNKGYVLLDYGHNPHALGAIAGMTRQSQYCRVTAVITVPGDRADWIIQEVGRVAARGFDRIIIREDQDLRGRAVGEIARLLESSILSERPDCDCSIVFEEQAALKRAMDEMRDGELVVFFYEELNQVMQVLEQAGACPVVRCEEQADVTAYA